MTRARPVSLGLLAIMAVSEAGCGTLIDTVYLSSNRTKTVRTTEGIATGRQDERVGYELDIDSPELRVSCQMQTRNIERRIGVMKKYRYRGGYSPIIYRFMAGFETLVLAVPMAAAGHNCGDDGACWPIYVAAPVVVDAIYSIVRSFFIDPPTLIDKQRRDYGFGESDVLAWVPVACPDGLQLEFGASPSEQIPQPDSATVAVAVDGTIAEHDRMRLLELASKVQARATIRIGDREKNMDFERCRYLDIRRNQLMRAGLAATMFCAPPANSQPH